MKSIKPSTVYIAGGTGVVLDSVEQNIKSLTGSKIVRFAGSDRYDTSMKIAKYFKDKITNDVYATDKDFHDSLAAVSLAAKNKASIILVDNNDFKNQLSVSKHKGFVIGSTETLSNEVANYMSGSSNVDTGTTTAIPNNTDITSKFTDVNFKTAVYKLIGKSSPSPILYSDVKNIKTLDVSKNTALTWLSCDSNQITTLDVTKNTALISLNCSGNQLTTLDLSKNTSLSQLFCVNTQITTLDLSKNTALSLLKCSKNQLTTLYLTTHSTEKMWDTRDYKTQYTDSTHTTTNNKLVITIKN